MRRTLYTCLLDKRTVKISERSTTLPQKVDRILIIPRTFVGEVQFLICRKLKLLGESGRLFSRHLYIYLFLCNVLGEKWTNNVLVETSVVRVAEYISSRHIDCLPNAAMYILSL